MARLGCGLGSRFPAASWESEHALTWHCLVAVSIWLALRSTIVSMDGSALSFAVIRCLWISGRPMIERRVTCLSIGLFDRCVSFGFGPMDCLQTGVDRQWSDQMIRKRLRFRASVMECAGAPALLRGMVMLQCASPKRRRSAAVQKLRQCASQTVFGPDWPDGLSSMEDGGRLPSAAIRNKMPPDLAIRRLCFKWIGKLQACPTFPQIAFAMVSPISVVPTRRADPSTAE